MKGIVLDLVVFKLIGENHTRGRCDFRSIFKNDSVVKSSTRGDECKEVESAWPAKQNDVRARLYHG